MRPRSMSWARRLAPENTDYLAEHAAFLSRRRQHAKSDELFAAAFERDPENRKLWLTGSQSVDRSETLLPLFESREAAGTLS